LCARRRINANALHPRPTGERKAKNGDDEDDENNNGLFVVVVVALKSSPLLFVTLSSRHKNRYNINAGAKTNQYDECSPAEIPAGNKNA
jgi:hypothetical protein|tara:strand:- start:164 stop:430 length:267 start_codon:yes stop_codon:yes gene_type:complete